ncbi:CW-type Zinc Finger [Striga hermonthica]|uniref:CW-type Zinc Finger n=1 Tax=Striga hermonthica TaxID=68872 RepID=A0A9N7RJ91_STRHE|nr:CW-type Zinc Finger [Striga hermonthica]
MVSVGSRDGSKRISLGLEMEETELEEGEALSYNNEARDSTIDPDIALSYIEEKLQNVLGHFQKDFEGGVSAENLGAKFGGYGSFLPTYQRSPSGSHTKIPAEPHHNHDLQGSPKKLHVEDQRKNSLASSCASSPLGRPHVASGKLSPLGSSLKGINSYLQSINSSDQRTLKVRIKVGSENSSTRKNAAIYSGLGLVVSPSSSLDDSPTTCEGHFGKLTEAPEASPTSILQMMTAFPGELLLSPISKYLICLTEKKKPIGKFETKTVDKTSVESSGMLENESLPSKCHQKKSMLSEKGDVSSMELKNKKSNGNVDYGKGFLLKKERETEVSNASKLPLLSGSQNNSTEPAKLKDDVKVETFSAFTENGILDNESAQVNSGVDNSGKTSESKNGNPVSNNAVFPSVDQSELIVGKKSEEGLKPASAKPSTGSKKKQKVANGADRYKDFFGDVEFEDEDKESISGEMNSPGRLKNARVVGKSSSSDDPNISKEKFYVDISQKPPQVPDIYHLAPPNANAPSSQAPAGSVPSVKEDWVLCDKCQKWRLLPLGTNVSSLPDKWICRMLTWLPGMNRCNVPQEETTNALRALYNPSASIPGLSSKTQSCQLNNNNSAVSSMQMATADASYPAQENQSFASGKKKYGSMKVENLNDLDGSTNSSHSRKKGLGTSGKTSNLNIGNNSPSRKSVFLVEKYSDHKEEKQPLSNSSDRGTNLKLQSKREADTEGSGASKRIKSEELHADDDYWTSDNRGSSSKADCPSTSFSNKTSRNDDRHKYNSKTDLIGAQKCDEKDSIRKRKAKEQSDQQKERKAKVSHKDDPDNGHFSRTVQAVDYSRSDMGCVNPTVAADSSSPNVSGSHKNKASGQEVKSSPVESVSSSPIRYPNIDKVTSDKDKDMKKDGGLSGEGVKKFSEQCQFEEKANVDPSLKKKPRQGLSSHLKDNARACGDKVQNSSHDSLHHEYVYEERPKSRNIKSQEKKLNNNIHQEQAKEKLPKRSNQAETNGTVKSCSLPPLARISTEPVFGTQKEIGVKSSALDLDNGEGQKAPNQRTKVENLKTHNSLKVRDIDAPTPLQKDSSIHAANSALKEAKDLKHLADRLKNNGSTESIGFYFQAALKFLHGASLLENGSSEATKHNDLMHSMHIYSSTAKLCQFCAHEYEKLKDMAAASLAYKCMEVAYLRVVYSSHNSASRDRNELQTALQIVPPGESPSSSASDVDNLNHQITTEKPSLAKAVGSPQVCGSHIITSRNRSGFLRILNFAQDVNFAMEASRKSRIAFTAATAKLCESSNKESFNSLKNALHFNFHDVEELLRLVRFAMEAINR